MEYRDVPSQSKPIVKSPCMIRVYDTVSRLIDADSTVLLCGETGVGKSFLADYIYSNSHLNHAPFVKINCNAIPAELFSSELFGYAPNAFTGASSKGKTGLLAAADHGTVLFDKIDELPLECQSTLLQFLQDMTLKPIGSLYARKISVRILCTSGRDLLRMTREGLFRLDLYYRLNTISLFIPPLRERREEIQDFIWYFIRFYADLYKFDVKKIDRFEKKIRKLSRLDWYGNLHEIKNFARQICLFDETGQIIDTYISKKEGQADGDEKSSTEISGLNQDDSGFMIKPLREAKEEFERQYIKDALGKCKNINELAGLLGISRSTLYRKIAESDRRDVGFR